MQAILERSRTVNITQLLPFTNSNNTRTEQIHVKPQAAIRFNPKFSGGLLVCQGSVWVTRKNDLIDYFLHEGQTLQFRAGDYLVMENQSSSPETSRVCFYEQHN